MSTTIKPCHCGHKGKIDVTLGAFWYAAECPSCRRKVEAFTKEGLVEAWNKPATASHAEGGKV